jgi:hypothetical protein
MSKIDSFLVSALVGIGIGVISTISIQDAVSSANFKRQRQEEALRSYCDAWVQSESKTNLPVIGYSYDGKNLAISARDGNHSVGISISETNSFKLNSLVARLIDTGIPKRVEFPVGNLKDVTGGEFMEKYGKDNYPRIEGNTPYTPETREVMRSLDRIEVIDSL